MFISNDKGEFHSPGMKIILDANCLLSNKSNVNAKLFLVESFQNNYVTSNPFFQSHDDVEMFLEVTYDAFKDCPNLVFENLMEVS